MASGDFLPPLGAGDASGECGMPPEGVDSLARWLRRPAADVRKLVAAGVLASVIEDRRAELRAFGYDADERLAQELREVELRVREQARHEVEVRAEQAMRDVELRITGDAAACRRYMESRRTPR